MPENVPPTTATLSQLTECALASGSVAEGELASLAGVVGGDPRELSRLLFERGLLTDFQLAAFNEGRGSSLCIGNYEILDRLGAGGMGTVYKARHRRMKRIVALKVLSAKLSENPLFVKRFQREVETIAALGHPNIVMAYDADEADIGHFLVMEFVNGPDLAAFIEREGSIPLVRAVDFTLQTARGLTYAHSQGIIHRDIKPHNLLLDESGAVKVTDLGLARLNHSADGTAAGADMTMAGSVIGTPDYMPPEQAVDSTAIDHRADIYSLGCTLHFLLTGRPPYSGASIMAILLKHRDGEIPLLSAARSAVPPQLDDLFGRMIAKTPESRVQQMSEVVAELEAITAILAEHADAGPTTLELPFKFDLADSTIDIAAVQSRTQPVNATEPLTTVLVVEPSRVQASIIKSYLQEFSLSVVGTVSNGISAIEAVRSLRPRAVISAMYLADIKGVELAEQIRREIKVDAPGFVLVTSESDSNESALISTLKRVVLLAKPFSAEQLLEALNQVTGASMPLQTPADTDGTSLTLAGKKDRSQLRVLIADDSSTARIRVRTVLQGLGFEQFLEVPDGAYAIEAAAREKCDLIVTDYNMPLMDGRALVSYLKQNPATAAIPIMMVTSETEPGVLDLVRDLGVVAIFEKAFPAGAVGPILDSLFG